MCTLISFHNSRANKRQTRNFCKLQEKIHTTSRYEYARMTMKKSWSIDDKITMSLTSVISWKNQPIFNKNKKLNKTNRHCIEFSYFSLLFSITFFRMSFAPNFDWQTVSFFVILHCTCHRWFSFSKSRTFFNRFFFLIYSSFCPVIVEIAMMMIMNIFGNSFYVAHSCLFWFRFVSAYHSFKLCNLFLFLSLVGWHIHIKRDLIWMSA